MTSDNALNAPTSVISGTSARSGLIALSRRQKPSELFSALVLRRGALRRFKVLRPALSRESSREIGELLRLKCEDLVAGLGCLQGTTGALTRCHKRGRLDAVGIEVADDAGLNPQGVLQRRDRILPARLSVGDQRLIRLVARGRRIAGRERAIDLLDVVGNSLGLGQQLLGPLDRRLQVAAAMNTAGLRDSSPG